MFSRLNRISKHQRVTQKWLESNESPLVFGSKKIVNSWDEFSPLKHIIVGRPDGSCIAPDEPASKHKIPLDSDMKGKFGPRPAESVKKAQKQMDHFCDLLRSHGVRVDRPEPIDWNNEIVTPFF